jgi:hypothetical protein
MWIVVWASGSPNFVSRATQKNLNFHVYMQGFPCEPIGEQVAHPSFLLPLCLEA